MLVSVREHRAYQELKSAYKDPSIAREAQSHINTLMMATLNGLIDRSLLVKEANKRIKKIPKMLDRFYEESDQVFRQTRDPAAATTIRVRHRIPAQGKTGPIRPVAHPDATILPADVPRRPVIST